tara:strand:- start:403 stop:648 length:246 start_codon:yes stop_codon:yes gene_type:complete
MIEQILTKIFTSQVMRKAFTPTEKDPSSDLNIDVPAPSFKEYMRQGSRRQAQGSKAFVAQAARESGITGKYNQLLKQRLIG